MGALHEGQLLLLWLLGMSALAFAAMGIDKGRARRGQRRIPEARLFLYSALGGAVGGFLGIYAFRHKTKHWYFVWGFGALALFQLGTLAAVWLGFSSFIHS